MTVLPSSSDFSLHVAEMVERVGYSAGRYVPGLGAYIDVNARLNTLLEVRKYYGGRFGDLDKPEFKQGYRVREAWQFDDVSDGERADRLAFSRSVDSKLAVLDNQISGLMSWRSRLDRNNTIDQRPDWLSDFRRYQREWPVRRIFSEYGFARGVGSMDIWAQILREGLQASRHSEYISRLDNEIACAVRAGWFLVFDTLTIAPDREAAFLADPYAVRDHVRRLARRVNVACGRKAGDPFDDVFRFFGVPEYGKARGRLHFHMLYFMRRLPSGCVDPNLGSVWATKREVTALKCWNYGFSAPIALRYSGDAFTRLGWAWPVDKKGVALPVKPPLAVARYVAKYVGKSLKEKEAWLKVNPNGKAFRIRMTRSFGLTADLSTLSLRGLLEVSCLHYSVTSSARLLRRQALRQLSLKLAGLSIADFLGLMSPRRGLLARLRDLTAKCPHPNRQSFIDVGITSLRRSALSDEVRAFVDALPRLSRLVVPLSGK